MTPADILDTPAAGPAIIRGGSLRVIGYAAGILVSVASTAVLTRYLGVVDYGRYAAVFSVIMIVAGLSEAGMTNAAVREYSLRSGEDRERMMRALLGLRLVIASAGVLVAVGFTVLAGYGTELLIGAAGAGIGVVVAILSGTLAVSLQATLRVGWVSLLEVLRSGLTGAGLIAAAAAGAGLGFLLSTPLPVNLAILAATFALVRREMSLRPAFDGEAWRELLKITIPFAVVTAVGILYGYISLPLVSLVATAHATGIYGAAFRVFAVLSGIPATLVTTAFPLLARAARDDHPRLQYAMQRLFEMLVMLGALMTLLTVVGAPVAVAVIADEATFRGAEGVLRLQALALVSTCGVALWGFALLSLHRTRSLVLANSAGLVVTVALTLALAPIIGAYGAATASVAGDLVLAIGSGWALFRAAPWLRPHAAVVWRTLASAVLAGVPMAFLPLPASIEMVLAAAIYLAALGALRAYPQELREALTSLRHRTAIGDNAAGGPPSAA